MKENARDRNQGNLEATREEWSQRAAVKAKERARAARWDINIAIALFAVLTAVVVLSYGNVRIELVSAIALLGLSGCWFWGWKRERDMYPRFYDEELVNIACGEGTSQQYITVLMELVAKDVENRKLVAREVPKEKEKQATMVKPGWSKWAIRATLIAVVVLLLVIGGGTAFVSAEPDHPLAAPFRGMAIAVAEASSAPIRLIEAVRAVVATHERSVISTAVQSMRVIEGLREVPAITAPTNDMAGFPSPEHPLFPQYLDRRFSQFKYTVDSDGIVTVDKSTATTDASRRMIEEWLDRLREEE